MSGDWTPRAVVAELDALTGKQASEATRETFRRRLEEGHLDDVEVEIEVTDAPTMPFEVPGMPGANMPDLGDLLGRAFRREGAGRKRKLKVPDALRRLTDEETDRRLDKDDLHRAALANAEGNGIVFIDEIDKIAVSDVRGGSVSREGVQRDLLPLIEGTTVATRHGPLKTDHILFIASGAFHVAKPSDLLPELQGRLPIRVELAPLTEDDFVAILSATKASLVRQYTAMLATEGVTVAMDEGAVRAVARLAADINARVENIGARRLQTVMEKLFETLSFEADARAGETVAIGAGEVEAALADTVAETDLTRFIL